MPILSPKPTYTNIKTRALTDANIKAFREKLSLTNWSDIYTITDAQSAYESFLDRFNTILNSTMPLVKKRVKCYSKSNKPWVSSAIKKSIHRKNSLYRNYFKNKTIINKEKYKKYKNNLTTIIRVAEKSYYNIIILNSILPSIV